MTFLPEMLRVTFSPDAPRKIELAVPFDDGKVDALRVMVDRWANEWVRFNVAAGIPGS